MKNMPLKIISPDFDFLGEIDEYESLILVRRFFSTGEFELHIFTNENNAQILEEDNLIMMGTSEKKAGVIEHVEKDTNEEGKDNITIVKGFTLDGILKRRITVPPNSMAYDTAEGSQETIIKQFVHNNIVNPADINRKIPQVVIAKDMKRGNQDKWRTRFDKLDEKVSEVAAYSYLGFNIELDIQSNKWVFDILEGRNLTTDQEILPPVIFSVDFDNIKTKHLIQSSVDYKNIGYCGGSGEEDNRLVQQVGDAKELDRREVFIDCSDIGDINELITVGNQKLDEFKQIESFEAQILPKSSFIYEEDYDLGDIVTVLDRKWGVILNSRITEIKEVYELNGFNIEVIFGNQFPTLIKMIKRQGTTIKR